MAKRKLSTNLAASVKAPARGVKIYTDTELAGFYLRVTSRGSKTWLVQRRIDGKPVRRILGRYPDLNGAEARETARTALGQLGLGVDPIQAARRARARSVTLHDAIEMLLASKSHAPRTAADYWTYANRYMKPWLKRSLRDLGEDREGVRERHARIIQDHGKTVADYSMRIFRAAYRRARRQHPDLPEPPTTNVDFSPPRRKVVRPSPDELQAWGRAVVAIDNPVRRDANLFMILTGMRLTAACEARVADVDVEAGSLRVPNPKGGAARAFDLPLSGPLLDLARHRFQQNQILVGDSPWLFPSPTSKSGRLIEARHKTLGALHGHALRHLYASLALESGVPVAELKILLNHKMADVTFGYLHIGIKHLREYQERASARILAALGLRWTAGSWPPVRSVRPEAG